MEDTDKTHLKLISNPGVVIKKIIKDKTYWTNLEAKAKELLKLKKDQESISFFPKETTGAIDPDAILAGAFGKLNEVIVIGVDFDDLYFFASSTGELSEILWLMERIKHRIIFAPLDNE